MMHDAPSSITSASENTASSLAGTLVLKIGYRGTDFAGFAAQPKQRTIAGELEQALQTALRRPVELECAGRTDAGVHALAQHVSVPLLEEELTLTAHKLWSSLTALTPDDISIRGIYRAPQGFSARFDAQMRSYRYRIACGYTRPILAWDHAWWLRQSPKLDIESMQEAAHFLCGEHDFASFCKTTSRELLQSEGRSTSRFIQSVNVEQISEAQEELICIDVCGNAFLHNMVRIICGTLAEVGRGHKEPLWIKDVLDAKDRRAAGQTAPAKGLTFAAVEYDHALLRPW